MRAPYIVSRVCSTAKLVGLFAFTTAVAHVGIAMAAATAALVAEIERSR